MRYSAYVLAISAVLTSYLPANASTGDSIGSTLKVVDMVTAQLQRDTRVLKVGDRVHQDERIDVATSGSSEIKLDDDTKLALGPGATLTLDKFVYDPDRSNGAIILNLVKGTFRFITGKAAKPAYVIKVPTAAITVRGTIFDLYVQDSGTTWLLLHEGGVEACNARGQCILDREPGKLIRIGEDGEVEAPVRWQELPGSREVPFDTAFPFVASPPSIDPSPIFSREAIIDGEPPDPPTEEGTSRLPRWSDATDGPRLKTDGLAQPSQYADRSAAIALPLAVRPLPTRPRLDPEAAGRLAKVTSVLAPEILDRVRSHYEGKNDLDRILHRGGLKWNHLKPDALHLGERVFKFRQPRSRIPY